LSRQWSYTASTWERILPPLKPVAEDLRVITGYLGSAGQSAGNVLILGVTREYLALPWPGDTSVRALDYAPVMLRTVWQGAAGTGILGDWRRMPVSSQSQQAVLLDAGLCLLPWPHGQEQVVREVARVLVPGGLFIVRVLVLPDVPETTAEVMEELEKGQIPDLSHLRIRLWMAMQHEYRKPATNRQFWYKLQEACRGRDDLASRCDTTVEYIGEINRKSLFEPERDYEFAALAQYIALFTDSSSGFEILEISTPTYKLGSRCPTFVLRKLPA
jgi:SAM-dependent methyltransferase